LPGALHLAGGGEGVADFVGFGVLHRGDAGEELAAVAVEDVFDERRLEDGLRAVGAHGFEAAGEEGGEVVVRCLPYVAGSCRRKSIRASRLLFSSAVAAESIRARRAARHGEKPPQTGAGAPIAIPHTRTMPAGNMRAIYGGATNMARPLSTRVRLVSPVRAASGTLPKGAGGGVEFLPEQLVVGKGMRSWPDCPHSALGGDRRPMANRDDCPQDSRKKEGIRFRRCFHASARQGVYTRTPVI
jgi:hypothetical protein